MDCHPLVRAFACIVESVVLVEIHNDRTSDAPPLSNKCSEVCWKIKRIADDFGSFIEVSLVEGHFVLDAAHVHKMIGTDKVQYRANSANHTWISVAFPTLFYKLSVDPTYMQFTDDNEWRFTDAMESAEVFCEGSSSGHRPQTPAQISKARERDLEQWTIPR